jgi:ubiquitin related modifier 1
VRVSLPHILIDTTYRRHRSGGLEILLNNITKHTVTLPSKAEDGKPTNVRHLIKHILDNLVKDPRKELFVQDGSV